MRDRSEYDTDTGMEPRPWVPNLGNARDFSYLISRGPDDRIQLFNARTPKQVVQLDLLRALFDYVDQTGALHIVVNKAVESAESPPDGALHLHTISLATGQILSSTRRPLCLKSYYKLAGASSPPVVHHSASRIYGFLDPQTLVIMDATTLEVTATCNISPRHADAHPRHIFVRNVAWSTPGDMLAVSLSLLSPDGSGLAANSEAHIYSCNSGECLQSFQLGRLDARHYELQWSARLHAVAVFCRMSPVYGASLGASVEGRTGSVHIAHPAAQQVLADDELAQENPRFKLRDCHWTPGGDLLILDFQHVVEHRNGFRVMDPLHNDHHLQSPTEGL